MPDSHGSSDHVDEVTANAINVLSNHAATMPATPTSSGLLIDPVTSISVVTAFNGNFESQGFEGNEKRLEIDLIPDSTVGPLKLSRQFWDDVLDLVCALFLRPSSHLGRCTTDTNFGST